MKKRIYIVLITLSVAATNAQGGDPQAVLDRLNNFRKSTPVQHVLMRANGGTLQSTSTYLKLNDRWKMVIEATKPFPYKFVAFSLPEGKSAYYLPMTDTTVRADPGPPLVEALLDFSQEVTDALLKDAKAVVDVRDSDGLDVLLIKLPTVSTSDKPEEIELLIDQAGKILRSEMKNVGGLPSMTTTYEYPESTPKQVSELFGTIVVSNSISSAKAFDAMNKEMRIVLESKLLPEQAR